MKRIILIVLMIGMLISASTSCGQSNVSNAAGNAAGQGQSAVAEINSIYKEKGSELTDYLDAFMNAEKAFEEPLNKLTDMPSMFAQMNRVMVNLPLVSLTQYDLLSVKDLPREEGKLMLSGSQAIREKSGNKIKFSSHKESTEDLLSSKKGDIYSEQGVLDTKTNTLTFESKTERSGNVISRTVIECVILKDGTYLLQYLSAKQSGDEEDLLGLGTTAVFKHFNQKEYSAVTADFDGKVDFTYDSIIGKGDVQTDAMASKYKVNGKFTVKDGTATFER